MSDKKHSIKDYLNSIKDPRRSTRNKRHELIDILIIALCGMLSGAEDWVSIADYGKVKLQFFKRFLALPNGIPSHDTFNRVFAQLDPQQFSQIFVRWVQSYLPLDSENCNNLNRIAIDGKTLRRSHDNSNNSAAIHMVSAWVCEHKLIFGQIKTAEKSNEITAIPELLESLILKDCLITIDAMGCQKDIARKIINKGGNYLLAVKGNQPRLYETLQQVFEAKQAKIYNRPAIDFIETQEKNRDRIETRRCWVYSNIQGLESLASWESVASIAMVESERVIRGKKSVERRYYICSIKASADEILRAVRGHWGIENSLHWVLDMAFREDECRVRKGHGAENLSRLRHMALNLLKQDESVKVGIKNKRLRAGWDNEYLLKLLNSI